MSFKVTSRLKRYARSRLGVRSGESDRTIQKAVGRALKEGKLSLRRYEQMAAGVKAASASASASASVSESGSESVRHKGADESTLRTFLRDATERIDRRARRTIEKATKRLARRPGGDGADSPTPAGLFSRGDKAVRARVKSAVEGYDGTRKSAVCPKHTRLGGLHPMAGQPAVFDKAPLYHGSEMDKAIAGAYFKWHLSVRTRREDIPRNLQMTDHDRDLVSYALHELSWTGEINPVGDNWEKSECARHTITRRKLQDFERKALLDDSTSGGLEAAPIVFDDMVILTPLLYGELFPRVNVVNIARGRRIEGWSMANPTFSDGVAEGTAITPFDTAAFIASLDTTIYPTVAAMEMGLDFEDDAPNDVGGLVVQRFGDASMAYLDKVIAVGNGTSQPTGIFVATGMTAVSADNGVTGPPTVSDYESLMFGVAKQYRREPGASCGFLGNETTYRRSRGIPVGPGDQRRVFGMTHGDYQMLDYAFAIQNDATNSQAAFANFKRYRMYRRLGLQIRIETAGQTLALKNTRMVVLRMRFGGQPEIGGAFAVGTDWQQ